MRSSLFREVVMSTFHNFQTFNWHKQSIHADNNSLLQPCSVTVCCRTGCTCMWWWVCSLSHKLLVTCLEWPRESGCLKKESGSFLILMGSEDGCRADLLGFITALKRASSSVCESPRTCTICCPAGGAPRCASMSPKFLVSQQNLSRKKK